MCSTYTDTNHIHTYAQMDTADDADLSVPLSTSFRNMVQGFRGGASSTQPPPQPQPLMTVPEGQVLHVRGGNVKQKPKCSAAIITMAVIIGLLSALLVAIVVYAILRKTKPTATTSDDEAPLTQFQAVAGLENPTIRAYYNHAIQNGYNDSDALSYAQRSAERYWLSKRLEAEAVWQESQSQLRQQQQPQPKPEPDPQPQPPIQRQFTPQPRQQQSQFDITEQSLQEMLGASDKSMPQDVPPRPLDVPDDYGFDGGSPPPQQQESHSTESFVELDDL